ncbi:hypothetical protein [Mesorhizobium sp. WSM3860]|uniref:hypothetical protein n=1 Tax=Mesorhizobium sp. WSM3860 TaxID=2029403 RepID=UPI0015969157|nr:hypothetical protein [Mesorhizobium sp. WSM3860]
MVRTVHPSAETLFGNGLAWALAPEGLVSVVVFAMAPLNFPPIYFTRGEHIRFRYKSAMMAASHLMSQSLR